MNYDLRFTIYDFEWNADKSRLFIARFSRFRNKSGMDSSVIGVLKKCVLKKHP